MPEGADSAPPVGNPPKYTYTTIQIIFQDNICLNSLDTILWRLVHSYMYNRADTFYDFCQF